MARVALRGLAPLVLGLALVTGAAAQGADADLQRVVQALDAKDCTAAAKALNDGLAKASPPLLMLAGAMFDEGLCLKPNWPRAARLYERAAEGGESRARVRLVAGFALPANGPDLAATLWWARQTRLQLPAPCAVADAQARTPEAFVEALKAWPAGRIESCVHVAGVLASVLGDFEARQPRRVNTLPGTVVLTFAPGNGRIDVHSQELRLERMVNDPTNQPSYDLQVKTVQRNLVRQIEGHAERALQRYPRPAGIPGDWRIGLSFDLYQEG